MLKNSVGYRQGKERNKNAPQRKKVNAPIMKKITRAHRNEEKGKKHK